MPDTKPYPGTSWDSRPRAYGAPAILPTLFTPPSSAHGTRLGRLIFRLLVSALLAGVLGVFATAPPPSPALAAQGLAILTPATNDVAASALFIAARIEGASAPTYSIEGGPSGPLVLDPQTGLWRAYVDAATVAAGMHDVSVSATIAGNTVTDTAWRVTFPGPGGSSGRPKGSGGPSVSIVNPLSSQALGGTITVQATASNAASVAYAVDGGTLVFMSRSSDTGVWQGSLDTTKMSSGSHSVDVVAFGNGAAADWDRAWNVQVTNSRTPATATPTPSPGFGPPSITIGSPLSNQSYSGTITVQALVTNAASVAYVVDGGAQVPMSFNSGAGVWQANLDTSGLRNGTHTVDVINTGGNGASVKDRAWNVGTNNTITPPPPTPTVSSTPTTTPVPTGGRAWGVNYAGAEFNPSVVGTLGTDYVYPADSSRNSYFASKGLRLARLPITWERLQREAYAPLSANDVAGIRSVLDTSAAAGQKVIIDLHNYRRYYGSPLTVADAPKLANFWQQLAAALRGHPGLYGYELMDEPHDLPDGGVGWAAIAQFAANGVRQSDTSAWVLVPGYGWQTTTFWASDNPTLAVQDSANHLQYAAHLYFDSDFTGFYSKSYDADGAYPTIGVDRVQPFLAWLASHNARGMLTEYGIPNTDSHWLTVLDGFLNAISSNPNITGGTYWAAGPWWGSYPLSVEPNNGLDQAQMTVLTRYAWR